LARPVDRRDETLFVSGIQELIASLLIYGDTYSALVKRFNFSSFDSKSTDLHTLKILAKPKIQRFKTAYNTPSCLYTFRKPHHKPTPPKSPNANAKPNASFIHSNGIHSNLRERWEHSPSALASLVMKKSRRRGSGGN
jgi:hypothetical protein